MSKKSKDWINTNESWWNEDVDRTLKFNHLERILDDYEHFLMKNLNQKLKPEIIKEIIGAWKQFKLRNWYDSDAVDVEGMLMDKFAEFYHHYLQQKLLNNI
jgi:hypothetical protein